MPDARFSVQFVGTDLSDEQRARIEEAIRVAAQRVVGQASQVLSAAYRLVATLVQSRWPLCPMPKQDRMTRDISGFAARVRD